MAYRRKPQGTPRPGFEDPIGNPLPPPPSASASGSGDDWYSTSSSSSSSLAAKAIRASSAYRDSSLSSAYAGGGGVGRGTLPSSTSTSDASRYSNLIPTPSPTPVSGFKDVKSYEYTSMKNLNESKHGFWGALARKAKAILDDDNEPQQFDSPGNGRTNVQMPTTATRSKYCGLDQSNEIRQKIGNPNCIRD